MQQLEELKQKSIFGFPVRIADFILEKDRLFVEISIFNNEEMRLYDKVYEHITIDAPYPDGYLSSKPC